MSAGNCAGNPPETVPETVPEIRRKPAGNAAARNLPPKGGMLARPCGRLRYPLGGPLSSISKRQNP